MTHLLLSILTLLFLSALTVGPHIYAAARLRLQAFCEKSPAGHDAGFWPGL